MPTKLTGLTDKEVAERREAGLVNQVSNQNSRSLGDILRGNILTPFNGLITVLAVVVTVVNRSPINALFFVAVLLNVIVGVAQELKAKLILDQLAIMVKPRARVLRNGLIKEIDCQTVVMDDLIVLQQGDQVVVDGDVVKSSGLEINESLLTGEVDPIVAKKGSPVMSGSMVVGGQGIISTTRVGDQAYAAQLAKEAKQFKRASSELINATNQIMSWIARILIVVAPILIVGQLRISHGDWQAATIHTVAAIVGMIPEGLVLLTSATFMLAVIKLARQKVLVQQLPAVETLARVDVLLLDKTGTITTGDMSLSKLIYASSKSRQRLKAVIATMASRNQSPTSDAITNSLNIAPLQFTDEIPFTSSRKWSALQVSETNYVLGAPEMVLSNCKMLDQANDLAERGYRTLALVKVKTWPKGHASLDQSEPLALVALSEQLRPDAAETLSFFRKQGVKVKVISGDSAKTVGTIAKLAGIAAQPFDARELPSYEQSRAEFAKIVQRHNVFGRVKPEQKRQIAAVLQQAGNVVAMTGDGVNDALALKKADLGIAMNSGAAATKSVAEIVLLDNKFSHLPAVLAEGRRVVANIERVSNLFIIKNVYSICLSLAVTALGLAYPFLPSQMAVISFLSIGAPAFFLALAPNGRRYQPGFLRRVMRFAAPTGVITSIAMLISYYSLDKRSFNLTTVGTSVSVVAMMIGLAVITRLARPLRGWKLCLIIACGIAFAGYVLWPPLAKLFKLDLEWATMPINLLVTVGAIVAIALTQLIIDRLVSDDNVVR